MRLCHRPAVYLADNAPRLLICTAFRGPHASTCGVPVTALGGREDSISASTRPLRMLGTWRSGSQLQQHVGVAGCMCMCTRVCIHWRVCEDECGNECVREYILPSMENHALCFPTGTEPPPTLL